MKLIKKKRLSAGWYGKAKCSCGRVVVGIFLDNSEMEAVLFHCDEYIVI